jgi:hypothetical protein
MVVAFKGDLSAHLDRGIQLKKTVTQTFKNLKPPDMFKNPLPTRYETSTSK